MKTLKSKLLLLTLLFMGIIAVSFALTKSEKGEEIKVVPKVESLKWFKINDNVNVLPGQPIAPNQATYIGEGPTPPTSEGCSGSTHQCVSGFRSDQVTSSNQLDGSQEPEMEASLKN